MGPRGASEDVAQEKKRKTLRAVSDRARLWAAGYRIETKGEPMAGRKLDDVRPGQIWRDRDKRMHGGSRRVKIVTADLFGVTYRVWTWTGTEMGVLCRSRYERFRRAFDLVEPAPADDAVAVSSTVTTG